MYRQGDVLVIPYSGPIKGEPVKPDNGRTILAYGEVTGHAHALDSKLATMYRWEGDTLLEVTDGAVLRHEEHTHIPLPAGNYRVLIQKEYTPEAIRNVAD